MALLHGGLFWHQGNAPNPAPPTIWLEIVAHDKADVIGTAIRSLLNQGYPLPLSIILVDDGSQDGTANAARAIIPAHATGMG
jgi:cellulose synthase/poly-beta-1,6-N-acetylglucosamine synthase-like glycosyltransferase